VGNGKKARADGGATKKNKSLPRFAISSSSPIGMLALHLLAQWRRAGRDGMVFLAENENRAERLGGVVHALDPSCEVSYFQD
jgi:transcription-repair coupling factor (superfamily II helicase)